MILHDSFYYFQASHDMKPLLRLPDIEARSVTVISFYIWKAWQWFLIKWTEISACHFWTMFSLFLLLYISYVGKKPFWDAWLSQDLFIVMKKNNNLWYLHATDYFQSSFIKLPHTILAGPCIDSTNTY